MDSNRGISDENFRDILSSMSGWYDRHGYTNMLKVLYRDLVTEPDKLYTATNVIEMFELLCTSGHLSSADLTVLYDTINVTQSFGLEPEIRKLTMAKLLNIRTVSISKFTHNRQMLIKVVKSLSDSGVEKISKLYNCHQEADRWELFVDLEQRREFCEENLDDFMRKITMYLIRNLHKDPPALMVTGDMEVATREACPRTSTAGQLEVVNAIENSMETRHLTEKSDEIFRDILSSMSGWYDRHKYINVLKVLYRDLVTEPDKLYTATNVLELFELLSTSGHLSSVDPTVLYDTISITQPFGLEPEIRMLTMAKLLNIRTVSISKFTHNRQMLIKVVKSLSDNGVKKISKLYNCHQEADRWELFVYLEQRREFCEENLDDFMRKITMYLIRSLHKDPPALMVTGDMEVVATRETCPRTSTAGDQVELMVTGETSVATREASPSTSRAGQLEVVRPTIENSIETQDSTGSITGSQFNNSNIENLNIVCNITEVHAAQGSITGIQFVNPNIGNVVCNTSQVPAAQGDREASAVNDMIIRTYLQERQHTLLNTAHLLTPPTWNSEFEIDLTRMFTDLVLLKENREDEYRKTKRCTLQGLLDVVRSHDSCKVLIEGDGGMGKTTLLKHIAHRWATQPEDETFKDKLVFFINVRDICKGEDVLDVIMKQIKLKDFNRKTKSKLKNKDLIQDFILNHDGEIVLLLDGYDELEVSTEDSILSIFKQIELKRCKVILTSRSGKLADFVKACDLHVKVEGFDENNIKRYIKKFFAFQNKKALGKSLTLTLFDAYLYHPEDETYYSSVLEMCKSPMLLLHICIMWREKQCLPDDMTDLFRELFQCILNQFTRKYDDEEKITDFAEIPSTFEKAMLLLGKCIYENMKQNKLSITKKELVGTKDEIELTLKLGFVYEDSPVSERPFRKVYTTPHKLLSEALAGFYLCKTSQQDDLNEEEWKEMRCNVYLHNTRVLAIGFLGKDASKLLNHWITNKDSHFCHLGKYFRYVKKENQEPVIQALDKHMQYVNFELKPHIPDVTKSLKRFISYNSKRNLINMPNDHFIQLVEQIQKGYSYSVPLAESEFRSKDLVRAFVHISIPIENHDGICQMYFEHKLADSEFIECVACECKKLGFVFNVTTLTFLEKTISNASFLVNLIKITPGLSHLSLKRCKITGAILQNVVDVLWTDKEVLTLTSLTLDENNLSNISGGTLARLLKLAPKLECLGLASCCMSGAIVGKLLAECDVYNVTLKKRWLYLYNNDLSDIDGASLAHLFDFSSFTISMHSVCKLCIPYTDWCNRFGITADKLERFIKECIECNIELNASEVHLCGVNLASIEAKMLVSLYKICPSLSKLYLKKCQISGSMVSDFFRECETIGVELKTNSLHLYFNDLSDIDHKSLVRLVKIDNHVHWQMYKFSANNLKGFMCECIEHNFKFESSALNLCETNLSSIGGSALATLLSIFPKLYILDMRKCNLSGTIVKNFLLECETNGVVLKKNMICLQDNDLSDIDATSLLKLVKIGVRNDGGYCNVYFKWSDYHLSAHNVKCLFFKCHANSTTFQIDELDLSDTDLSVISGKGLALLFCVFPKCHVLITKCRLSGRIVGDLLRECDRKRIELNSNIVCLRENDLSDIDTKLLVMLVNTCAQGTWNQEYTFKWSDYLLSVDNLHDMLHYCCESDTLNVDELDLSNTNLSGASGAVLALIWKVIPNCCVNMNRCSLSGRIVGGLLNECDKNSVDLKGDMITLYDNDLSNIDSASLGHLYRIKSFDNSIEQFTYHPRNSNMMDLERYCLSVDGIQNLLCAQFLKISEITEWRDYVKSAKKLQDLIDECDRCGIELECIEVNLSGINLAEVNVATLALLWKVCPKLKHVNMKKCSLSGRIVGNLLNEWDRKGVELKRSMVCVTENNLSDIDGVSLAKITCLIFSDSFNWSDYQLSSNNLQDFIKYCNPYVPKCELQCLNLSDTDLVTISVATLSCLFMVFPKLEYLSMNKCRLSGNMVGALLTECERNGVVLNRYVINLQGNDLSDIDSASLAQLWKILNISLSNLYLYNISVDQIYKLMSPQFLKINKITEWCRYVNSAAKLQDIIDECDRSGIKLECTEVNLSGMNLDEVNVSKLALLWKVCPKLKHVNMSECSLSGRILADLLNQCRMNGIDLNTVYVKLLYNDLSDINSTSLAHLLRMSNSSNRVQKRMLNFLRPMSNSMSFNLEHHSLSVDKIQDLLCAQLLKISGITNWCAFVNSVAKLQDLIEECYRCGIDLECTEVNLGGMNLAEVNVPTLALLWKICPKLKHVNMIKCGLSGRAVGDLLNEWDRKGVELKRGMICVTENNLSDINSLSLFKLIKSGVLRTMSDQYVGLSSNFILRDYHLSADNLKSLFSTVHESGTILELDNLDLSLTDLSAINGAVLALVFKVFPNCHINMRNCELSGEIVRDFLKQFGSGCNVMKCDMICLRGNDLSGIDSTSLAKLVRMSRKLCNLQDYDLSVNEIQDLLCAQFLKISEITEWCDYVKSAAKLQDLINECDRCDIELECSEVNLSRINLAEVHVATLVLLWKICPKLKHVSMIKCGLSGRVVGDLLNECDRRGVELKRDMICVTYKCLKRVDLRECNLSVRYFKKHLNELTMNVIDSKCGWTFHEDNDLSDIDSYSLVCLLSMIPGFCWKHAGLCVRNITDLIHTYHSSGDVIKCTEFNLELVNLATLSGKTLFNLCKIAPRLNRLSLAKSNITSSAIRSFVSLCLDYKIALALTELDVSYNYLYDLSGESLASLFSICPMLEHLDLSDCKLVNRNLLIMADCMQGNAVQSLVLDISFNDSISDDTVSEIERTFPIWDIYYEKCLTDNDFYDDDSC